MRIQGLIIEDATRDLRVTIHRASTANAVPTDSTQCAIAQELHGHKGVLGVSVGNSVVYVVMKKAPTVAVRYFLSPNDRAVVREFDLTGGVFPDGYTVTLVPPPARRRIGARAGQPHGSNVRTGKKRNVLHRLPTRHLAHPA